MSPIKPRGPAVPPSPPKVEDADQTIAEPPRDFTDEIFEQLTGGAPPPPFGTPPPAAGTPPRPAAGAPAADLPPVLPPQQLTTQPMYHAPPRPPPPAPSSAPMVPPMAPPSAPASVPLVPQSAPQSVPQGQGQEVRVQTPLWALVYLGLALLAIAFGLFVLFTQSRVVGHF